MIAYRGRGEQHANLAQAYRPADSELVKLKATHACRGRDAVRLSLGTPARDGCYRCTVKTPTGNAYGSLTKPTGVPAGIVQTYSATYPDEFEGSEPHSPGAYTVEWRNAPLVDPQPYLWQRS